VLDTLVVTAPVVARVATLAAAEVPGVHAGSASVTGRSGAFRCEVELTAVYGHDVLALAEAVRDGVNARVAELTGLDLAGVDVVVADMTAGGAW
jgi:uncharacterized alkaline shock family protein YloU